VSESHALARTEDLQNVCRWCDEFFEQHPEAMVVTESKGVEKVPGTAY
jgi:hypothetical protein